MKQTEKVKSVNKEIKTENQVIDIKDRQIHLPVVPFINAKTIRQLTDEQISHLESTVQGEGIAFGHYLLARNALHHVTGKNEDAVKRDIHLELLPYYDYSAVATMNAIAFLMYEIYQKHSEECVFIEAVYQLSVDDTEHKKQVTVDNFSITVDPEKMARFLLLEHYRDTFFTSLVHEEDRKHTYYAYGSIDAQWGTIGQTGLRKDIQRDVRYILTALGVPSKELLPVGNKVAAFIEMDLIKIDDRQDNMLEMFTKDNPSLVQFKDVVYDMDTHSVTKMSNQFRLVHFHDYDLPLGHLKKEDIPDDGTFIPHPSSYDEVMKEADLLIRRTAIIYKEDQIPFIMSFIGNLFYHNATRFQVAIASVGGGGLGKSFLWNDIIARGMLSGHASAIDQRLLNGNASQFLTSQLVGKELNLISELSATAMSKDVVHLVKSVSSGDYTQVEFKNVDGYTTQLYAKTSMLANESQFPPMRTTEANDDGFKRRFVKINCNPKRHDTQWMNDFNIDTLYENIPYFSLACMMTFMHHHQNGNIRQFHYHGGCSSAVIEGFTTQELVDDTVEYFASHDRYRLFFCYLPEAFENERWQSGNAHLSFDMTGFRKWLATTRASHFNDLFKEWHQHQFSTVKGASALGTQLEKEYGIKRKTYRTADKEYKVYGEKFTDLVESICLADNPDVLSSLISKE